MEEVGRPTILNEELFKKIKQSILDGNDLRETAKVCEINEGTLYVWHSDNYLNIADKISGWKRDRKLMLAEKNIEAILQLPIQDKDFVKTVSDMSKFVAETLDKNNYSKRTDLTTNNKELPTPILGYVPKDNSDNQNNTDEEENTSDSRGNECIQDNINTPILDTPSTVGQDTNADFNSGGINTTP